MNNRATKFNRRMLMGTLVLGVLVLALVFVMLYWSFQNTKTAEQTTEGDSIQLIINQ